MAHYTRDLKRHSSKKTPLIVLLCAMTYFVSYLCRVNYAAVMVEMIACGFDMGLVAIPLTCSSVTYGVGQLICGFLGDKLKPEKMILVGLLLTAAMNIALPFGTTISIMTIVWGVNGFAQAMLWPPIVKILTTHLSPAEYHKNVVYVSIASSLGTIVIYLLAPLGISLVGWKSVFFAGALFAVVAAILWHGTVYKAEALCDTLAPATQVKKAEVKKPFDTLGISLLAMIILAVAMQGILRDGIANWMPTYITEVFKVNSTVSILTGVALPAFSMFIMWFSAYIYRKWIKNESLCSTLFFGLCALSVGILAIAPASEPVLSVSMLMVANAATHGVNGMYTSMVVPNFARYGRTALVTGIINSATYVGSAVSTYGVALITEHFGWSGTMVSWFAVSLAGVLLAFSSVKSLNKLKRPATVS